MEAPGRDSHGDGLVGAPGCCSRQPRRPAAVGPGASESKRRPVSSSARRVLWNRSILPVVVGPADAGEPVGDALFAADAVEHELGWVGAEAAGEDLAVVGGGLPRGCRSGPRPGVKIRQTLRAVARSMSPAATQNREWSSIPVTALSSRAVGSARSPPMTSSCHSSMGRVPFPAPVSLGAPPRLGLDEGRCGPGPGRCWSARAAGPRHRGPARGPGGVDPSGDGGGAARTGGPRARPASGAGSGRADASGRPGRPARRSDSGAASCGRLWRLTP